MRLWLSLLALAALVGCAAPPRPTGVAATKDGLVSAESLNGQIAEADQMLERRQRRGEISEADRTKYLEEYVANLIEKIDTAEIAPEVAWKYGDVYRRAGKWDVAYKLYATAVKAAPTQDRRVNDSLQLARAAGALGKVDEAIATVKSTFDAPVREKAPILPATLYEVLPQCRGKERDEALAALLEEAISQHLSTVVDPASESGKAFLNARPHHVQRAWRAVIGLYLENEMTEEARDAVLRSEQSLARFSRA